MNKVHRSQDYQTSHPMDIPGAADPLEGLRDMRSRLISDLKVIDSAIDRLEARSEDATFAFGEVTVSSEDLRAVIDVQSLTHLSRLRRIADLVGGAVNLTQAANAMVKLGVSKGSKGNLMIYLHDQTTKSGAWEKVSPGTFRYVGPSPPGE